MAKLKKILLIGFLLRLGLALVSSYHPDILNHVDWGNRFWEYGAKGFYEGNFWGVSWPNQPLASMTLYALISKLHQSLFSFLWWLNIKIPLFPSFIFSYLEQNLHIILLKLPFILADLGLSILAYQTVLDLTKKKKIALTACLLFLFNPVLIYNSAIWGQTDSLINLLSLFGIWRLYKSKYTSAFFFLILSLFFKLSLVVWSPIVLLLLWQKRADLKKIILGFLLVSIFFIIVSLPFVHHSNVFSWLWYLFTNRVLDRQGDMLSGNAFNLWTLFFGQNLSLSESLTILAVSAKTWGRLITLTLFSLPLLSFFRSKKTSSSNLFCLLFFFSFSAFLFLTNMHERYLYPVFFPLIILVSIGKINIKWYIVLSLLHFLNLYNLWWYPSFPFLKNLLGAGENLLPRLLSLVLLLIFVKLYVKYIKSPKT